MINEFQIKYQIIKLKNLPHLPQAGSSRSRPAMPSKQMNSNLIRQDGTWLIKLVKLNIMNVNVLPRARRSPCYLGPHSRTPAKYKSCHLTTVTTETRIIETKFNNENNQLWKPHLALFAHVAVQWRRSRRGRRCSHRSHRFPKDWIVQSVLNHARWRRRARFRRFWFLEAFTSALKTAGHAACQRRHDIILRLLAQRYNSSYRRVLIIASPVSNCYCCLVLLFML